MKRRPGIKLETPNDIDSNTWDELCVSLYPSWCKQSRGIILAKKNHETLEWDVKTSLHPNVDKFIFEEIQDFFDQNNEDNKKQLNIDLWGKQFNMRNTEPDVKASEVIWLVDSLNSFGLAITLVEDLSAIFFYEVKNEGEIDKDKILSFVKLIVRMT
ncbi:uncharacterized protein cubi_02250 [Cryptosporidium ubiquitum]|uniref:Uncharacterized protein n=1 Tax=Cryptosporidium ubiquitum TaxID=857276 RepID=A0A1J4MHT5_9CRYT|nr:uncharacterized protein cubi_02250 [Cryptosporidium ubiquitum]OII73019.1 hypothetical protein cubi_02250 [Cryptosporidium ubiquitum]